jgi:hypothetical protein
VGTDAPDAGARAWGLASLGCGWRTEFILHRYGARVVEHADCIAVRTPGNPTFYWGNFVLLPRAPERTEVARWRERFRLEIQAPQPASRHEAIGIDGVPSDDALAPWQAAGFEVLRTSVLRLIPGEALAPPRARGDVRFRVLDLERDAATLLGLQCVDTDGYQPAGFRDFRRRQLARYAGMARERAAAWFGVWCDGVLAADCGLIRAGVDAREARFQHVETHPAWRRRGLCRTLVHGVGEWALRHWHVQALWMCADPHDVAIGIYRALGYRAVHAHVALQRRAAQDRSAPAGAEA